MWAKHRYHSKDRIPSGQATERKETGDVTRDGRGLVSHKGMGQEWHRNLKCATGKQQLGLHFYLRIYAQPHSKAGGTPVKS